MLRCGNLCGVSAGTPKKASSDLARARRNNLFPIQKVLDLTTPQFACCAYRNGGKSYAFSTSSFSGSCRNSPGRGARDGDGCENLSICLKAELLPCRFAAGHDFWCDLLRHAQPVAQLSVDDATSGVAQAHAPSLCAPLRLPAGCKGLRLSNRVNGARCPRAGLYHVREA